MNKWNEIKKWLNVCFFIYLNTKMFLIICKNARWNGSMIFNFHLRVEYIYSKCSLSIEELYFVNDRLRKCKVKSRIKGIPSCSLHAMIGNRIEILQFLRSSSPRNPPNPLYNGLLASYIHTPLIDRFSSSIDLHKKSLVSSTYIFDTN